MKCYTLYKIEGYELHKNRANIRIKVPNKQKRGWSDARGSGAEKAQEVIQAVYHVVALLSVRVHLFLSAAAGMDLCVYGL